MAETHQFNTRVAELYGINCAVILQNLWYWIKKNKANDKNFYDGNYWTYNSTKAFKELFPYLTQRQIETALKKLRDENIIITGNYNAMKYDRTLWYAITPKGESILHGCEMDYTQNVSGYTPDIKPIPNNKPCFKTSDNKPYENIISRLNEKSGMNYRATSKATQGHINARIAEGYTVKDFYTVIDKKCAEWKGTDMEKYLRPETLFGSKFENYLNAPASYKKVYGANGIAIDQNAPDDLAGIL